MGPFEAIGGVALLVLALLLSAVFGFLLFISPLLIWLNLRRLRIELHADLQALRASVERGAAPAAEPAPAPPPPCAAAPASGGAEAAAPADMIGFSCPECGKFFEGPASLAGSDYVCPECKASFHIH